ncbi:unnamed protein product, partial [Nesidiocoris tenuis]
DHKGTILTVARFLDKELTEDQVQLLEDHLSFQKMRQNPTVNLEPVLQRSIQYGVFGDRCLDHVRYFLQTLLRQDVLPSREEMLAELASEEQELIKAGRQRSDWNNLGEDNAKYMEDICQIAGVPPMPPILLRIYMHGYNMIFSDFKNFSSVDRSDSRVGSHGRGRDSRKSSDRKDATALRLLSPGTDDEESEVLRVWEHWLQRSSKQDRAVVAQITSALIPDGKSSASWRLSCSIRRPTSIRTIPTTRTAKATKLSNSPKMKIRDIIGTQKISTYSARITWSKGAVETDPGNATTYLNYVNENSPFHLDWRSIQRETRTDVELAPVVSAIQRGDKMPSDDRFAPTNVANTNLPSTKVV